ncbi:MAG TPA: hypothetical protein VNK04_12480 [Gemmataceae bacterium]|nr:hypothetical protein [Gemmataceae bacterium]
MKRGRVVVAPGRGSRRGFATAWAVVVLAVLGLVTGAIVWQMLAARRWQERRENQVQAGWLARSGLELAAARLLNDPTGYEGESAEIIPGSKVRIEVQSEPGVLETYRVTSEARCPADGPNAVVRSVTRRLRRITEKGQVRIEVVPVAVAAKGPD